MLRAIALFELRYQLRRPLLWLVMLFFTLMTFGAISSDSVQIGGAIGQVHRNAPFVILQMLGIMTVVGTFITTTFVAGSILRDFEENTHEMFFSRPIKKRDYLLGRFLGAILVTFVAFLGCPLGMLIGSLMPWLDPERLGPFSLAPYLFAVLVFALPNLFFSGSLFFSLASVTRSMLYTYLGLVGFFAAYFLSGTMLSDLESRTLAAMLDPFGLSAFGEATRYWTVVERNSSLPELAGILLYNRLLWVAVGLLLIGLSLVFFRYERAIGGRRRRRRHTLAVADALGATAHTTAARLPAASREFGGAAAFRQFLHQTRLEVTAVFKSVPFLAILAFGILNLVAGSSFIDQIFGTPVYPVTQLMLRAIQGSFVFLLVIIITFYSGELIWRERSLNLHGVLDAMPVPNWVYLGGKLVAQLLVVVAFLLAGGLATIGIQIYRGYFNFELPVYAEGLLALGIPFLLTCFLASFVQVASGNKFIGYLLMILYLISSAVLAALKLDHNLYQYASAPDAPYSDMNGYGHFVEPLAWFYLYWAFCAGILVCLSALLWLRGNETGWKQRLRLARERFRGPVRLVFAACVLGFVATGAWIFYNTNVINEYVPRDKVEDRQAEYEKKFRQYKDVDLPRVTAVYADVDIYPHERRVAIRGRYTLVNHNEKPLDEIHVTIPKRVGVDRLDFPAHRQKLFDEVSGYRIYELEEPLAPGAQMTMEFDLRVENPGFENGGSDTSIVENGTFFNNRQYFPRFGYSENAQLVDRNDRRKHGLEPVHRMAKVDDLFARRNTYLANDADWIDFETVVSTSADQIALAPGYLQREWTEGDRHYFHYKMDSPILHFYSYLSARYTVARDLWNDVAIEIYYHEPHAYNVARMIDSIKKSLDYFTANFGPYQHRQVRILEFPRYQQFAQSFPNTIPFSESIGFIARLDDDEDALDYPFYVTAHEVAHQWWAHQVIGGNVQGSTLLSETMSQYSALMVMEREYGKAAMRRFLKYELDRYLQSRGGELIEEMPLLLVENQPYIHYRKGSLVTYALRDYVGEEAFNSALARYTAAVKFQQPPYTNSLEFLDFVREAVPPEQSQLIADLFENITLYENQVEKASYRERDDGKYVVTVEAKARKVRADGQGVETEVPLDDWIDVGVFGEKPKDAQEAPVLYLAKHHVTEQNPSFELVVDAKPDKSGIDPFHKLVDRNTDDNLKRVERAGEAEKVAGK